MTPSGTARRRLLFLITSMGRGGAERQVVDLAVTMRARGSVVAVVSMIDPTDYQAELAAAGVELVSLGMRQGRPRPGALLAYARLVRKWRPHVVHAHMVHANLLARVGRVLNPTVPVVSTVHNVNEGARWREYAYRLTHVLSSATTAVSRAAAERYVAVGAVPAGGIVVLPNGFDSSRTAPAGAREAARAELDLDEEKFVWLTVGRLVPAKGHDMLLAAFRDVVASHPAARLLIAGEGEERPTLERRIDELGPGRTVSLLGERRDVPALLAAADAFVMSSRWEGLPMVLLEAAAHGLPIVTTDVGGCREVAVPGLGAIVTAPQTSAIRDGIMELMARPSDRRREIGENLRRHVEAEYDLHSVVERWESLYSTVEKGPH